MKMTTAIEALGALSQASRLKVFRFLVARGDAGATVSHLSDELGVPMPTLSFHLKALSHAGLVTSRRDGRRIHYRADFTAMRRLLRFLTEDCCGGNPEICNLASDHVSKTAG